ncbi:hypothetical protein BDW22DRAFT_813944 [Trametopsis cervina]|nr:hypothetical protein BDW22DRAFT_813944 [Trametopsis cervina]
MLSITPMLICQFMLNLRNITSNKSTSEQERTWSSVHFVGNMGQTLRAPGEEEDDGWDHELPQDQEEQQEDSNGVSLPSDIESGARDHEGVGEETMSRSQSGGGVVDEGA